MALITAQQPTMGWLKNTLNAMAKNKRWAASLVNGNVLFVAQSYPLILATAGYSDLLGAAKIACAGNGIKAYANGTHAGNADLDLALSSPSSRVFGVKVRLSDSPLNFKYGSYRIQVGTGTGQSFAAQSEVVVQATKLPAEVVILTVSNTGGQATVIGTDNPTVRIPYANSAVASTLACWAETLNMRDIGDIK